MEIKDISVENCVNNSFVSATFEGITHHKVLPWISVVQSVEGSYDIKINNGRTQTTGTGGIFLAPSSVLQTITHHLEPNTGRGQYRWVFMNITVNGQYDFDNLFSYQLIVPEEKRTAFSSCLDAVFTAENPFESKVAFYQLANLIYGLSSPKPMSKLTPAKNYIALHYPEKISVECLAKECYMSKSAFFSLFKTETQQTPIAYINTYRLSIAAEKIMNSDATISQIAKEVGFQDYAYFNKCFRKQYKMSPTDYRLNSTKQRLCLQGKSNQMT